MKPGHEKATAIWEFRADLRKNMALSDKYSEYFSRTMDGMKPEEAAKELDLL